MRLTINFLMKKARQKTNGEIPIYIRFTLNSKRVKLSTGIYCLPEIWDEIGQQIRGRNESARTLNNGLDKIQNDQIISTLPNPNSVFLPDPSSQ